MKILTITFSLGLSLSVFGTSLIKINPFNNDSLPPITVVDHTDTTLAAPAEKAWELSDLDSLFKGVQKTFVFEWHIGSNRLLKNNFSDASAMEHVNGWLSIENRFLFSQKRRLGSNASPFQLQTGLGFSGTVFSFKNERTISKDILGGSGTGLFPIFNMNTVWSSNWRYTHLNVPVMLHLDLSPKGTFNEGLNIGVGLEGRMRLASSAAYSGRDLDGDWFTRTTQSGFNTRILNYAILAQAGYKKVKLTGRFERIPLFREGAFEEDVFLGSLTLGFSFN
ncbi:MAG: Uncharacterised protein [Flavobacteriales bacterium UBA4585]|nr:MAG: Uncharacterised protein [Flavobacteriales bacterium UBA4585]